MQKPGILLIGGHHPREASGVSMTVYMALRLLYGYVKEEPASMNLLQNTAIVVVPLLNVDGYQSIYDHYQATGELTYVRKNGHTYDAQTQ